MAEVVARSLPRASSLALVGSRARPVSVMLVAAVSPFERPLPGSLFGLTLTTVELTILIALSLGVAAWLREPASFEWRTRLHCRLPPSLPPRRPLRLPRRSSEADAIRVTARLGAAAARSPSSSTPRAPAGLRAR